MRAAIRRALDSPPPRGAVVVVVAGLLVTLVAILLSRDPGGSGEDVSYKAEAEFPDSPTVPFGKGGETKIVGGVISTTPDNDLKERVYRVEASLRARAGPGAQVKSVSCEVQLPKGVQVGISDSRPAAFPRPLQDTADDAIKEAASVDFETDDATKAAVDLRNAFFKYVVGGNPSVSWPSIAEGQASWIWRYRKPVTKTRVNFAALLIAKGGQTVALSCTPQATNSTQATPRTTVKLPD
jgi:hypothetical protein